MAEAAVSLAMGTLKDLLLEEGRFLLGVSREVKQLQTQLKEIKCFLEDADKKQHESKTVKNWIKEIRDLAYRSEDVILEYAASISSDEQGRLRRLGEIFSAMLCKCSSLHQIGSEVSDIKSELSRLKDDMQNEGIRRIIDEAESSTTKDKENRKTFPDFEIGDCFVGMEDELERVLPLLLKQDEDEHDRVISIWGMGGIGKTTFAKKVYNDMIETKNGRYNSFAWVCISQQFEVRSVLEDVLKQLDPKNGEAVSSLSETQLIQKLCQIQKDERCMIVLDDLWKISHWNKLKSAFRAKNSQSKILVTTRNQEVATHVGFALELGLLNANNAWDLLNKKAFPRNNVPEFASQEDFERIGKEMVKRCGYLPLAISILGGVLSKKNPTIEDWRTVNEDINGSLYKSEGHDDKKNLIDPVLNLSYYDLPYSLKPCFLYLGKLNEDETICATDLYKMWIAQGMISDENSGGNNSLTDTAQRYLTELASRCMVQIEVLDYMFNHDNKTCKLHDVVRELCLSICEKEDFVVQNLDYLGDNLSNLPHDSLSHAKIRHLRIHFSEGLQQEGDVRTTNFDTSKSLRSLEILNDRPRNDIEFPAESIIDFRKFKLLRSLAIEGFSFPKRKLPKGITDLVLLRHLRLNVCGLDSLPQSISRLVYLDTLDLNNSHNVRIPDHVFKKMSRLKHLVLPSYVGETIGNYRLELDEGVEGLESLMEFDSSKHKLKCIKKMKSLRSFSASISDNESLSAITNAMATNWNKLSYCRLSIKPACELTTSEEGLLMLKQVLSCPTLYSLDINVGLGKLLERCIHEISFSKLVELNVRNCKVDGPMVILGKLPSLIHLCLLEGSFVGKTITSPASSFPQLKSIMIHGLTNLEEWIVEQGAMPVVSVIYLHGCLCLQKVPDGFSSLSSLQELYINDMPMLKTRLVASAGGVDGVDFHKVSHVSKIVYNWKPLRDA